MEENVEYNEREDEFDIHPIEEIHKRRLDLEDELVGVLATGPIRGEFEESAFRIPVLLNVEGNESEEDVIAVGPGTMRRKSPGEGRDRLNSADGPEMGDERGSKRAATNGAAKPAHKSRRR